MAFVEINNLWVHYGKFAAVKGLTLQIPRGEVFGFIGPNGAGKSSTIKVLATLLAPSQGWACLDEIMTHEHPQKVRRRIGYMPDFFGVYEDLTAGEYLHFFAAAYRLPIRERKRIVGDVLAITDLTAKASSPVDGLSRGMKQRLGIARVLLHDPDLLLLDEPASGLDPRARIEMRELLKELTSMGKTILISSHILHELSQLATRIGIIEAGELVAEGSLDDIYNQLSLKRIVHLQVSGEPEHFIAALKAIDGVASVTREVDRLRIQLEESVLSVETLHERIVALGARIYMFQPEAMDMETVFMKLTEGRTA